MITRPFIFNLVLWAAKIIFLFPPSQYICLLQKRHILIALVYWESAGYLHANLILASSQLWMYYIKFVEPFQIRKPVIYSLYLNFHDSQ